MDNKYIKQEAVLDMLNRFFRELEGHETQTLISDIKHAALELPTIEVKPDVRAKWVATYKGLLGSDYLCSNCMELALEGNSGHYDRLTDYCPYCGTIMKEEKN